MNDRVRKILDLPSKDAMQDSNKHSVISGMFMSSTLEASVFMEKNYSDNLHSIKNTEDDLTLKQMFDISEKLIVGQSDEIFGVSPINWEDSSWKQLSLVSDEEVISLSHATVYVCSDSELRLGKMNQNATSNTVWERQLECFKDSSQYRTELMMIKFRESGHPVFRATSPLSRGTLKSKGGGKLSIHFSADGDTTETVFARLFLLIGSVSTEQSQN